MISVLLPTYNADATIAVSVNSILRQTYQSFELLVLDDGSVDRTEEVVRQFTDERIRYFRLPHQGLTKTLNYGLTAARYDIIARMDADDISVPWRFERELEELQKHPNNVLISSWYAVFENKTIQYIISTPTRSPDIKKGLLLHSFISHPGLLCYKNTLSENGGYHTEAEIDAFQDYETWLKIKDHIEFAIIPEVLTFQRFRGDSLSNNIVYKQRVMYSIQKPYYDDLERHFNIFTEEQKNIYRGWREYFYGSKRLVREYWRNTGLFPFRDASASIAWFITFLPETLFVAFKEYRMRFRLEYLLKYHSAEMRELRKQFALMTSSK